jgi:1,4-alpha-glucan branching enzyme
MKRQPDGLWTIDIKLKPGTYNYMFVVDGEMWVTDPDAGLYRDDGFGYKNSVVRVRGS